MFWNVAMPVTLSVVDICAAPDRFVVDAVIMRFPVPALSIMLLFEFEVSRIIVPSIVVSVVAPPSTMESIVVPLSWKITMSLVLC